MVQFLPLSTIYSPVYVSTADISVSSSFLKTLCGAVPVLPYDRYHVALVN